MKIEVEGTRCAGHALCWREAPEVFPLDAEGYNALSGQGPVPVDDQHVELAKRGAAWCPEEAIRIVE